MKINRESFQRWRIVWAAIAIVCAATVWLGASMHLKSKDISGDYTSDGTKKQAEQEAKPDIKREVARYEGTSLTGYYLAGRFAESQDDMAMAANNMEEALRRNSNDMMLSRSALRVLVSAGRVDEAVEIADRIVKKNDGMEDSLATLLVAARDARNGKFDDARKLLDKPSVGRGMYDVIQPLLKQWVILGAPTAGKPIAMDTKLARIDFLSAFLHYHLALMNDMVGQKEAALTHYAQASDDQKTMSYRLVQALSNYYLRVGDKQKAQDTYDAYAKNNPSSELVPTTVPQIDKDSTAVVPMVQTPAQGMAETFFTTASLLFGEEVMREALIYLQLSLYLRPDLDPAQLMLANVLEQMKDYKGAIAAYGAINPDTVFYKRGQVRIALNQLEMGDKETALTTLKSLVKANPKDTEALLAVADIYRTDKDYTRAATYYSQAIEAIKTPSADHWTLFYARGICYERAGEWKKAEPDFKQALKLQPGQPDVLNYLGYSWLMQGENIAQAAQYIDQAFDQRPMDAHIIDSVGWVRYVQGHFDEALEFMEQAAELTPQDATVNEHLGDIYWRLGRRIEARFQWQRALLFHPEDKGAIEKKLEAGLPEFIPASEQPKSAADTAPVASFDKPDKPVKAE